MLPRVLLAAFLALSVLAAGCAKPEAPAPSVPSQDDGSSAPPADTPTYAPPAQPHDFSFQDKGSMNGAFDKSWPVHVSAISPRAFVVKFDLAGAQAGTPPTALVTLVLSDPAGKPIKTETIGVGQGKDSASWSIPSADIREKGEYRLKATAQTVPGTEGIPSAGIAEWTLAVAVSY